LLAGSYPNSSKLLFLAIAAVSGEELPRIFRVLRVFVSLEESLFLLTLSLVALPDDTLLDALEDVPDLAT